MPCTYISCVAERHMGRESTGTLIQAKLPEEGETLLSRFGGQVQELAYELVERGFAAAVASDAHSPRVRTPWMEDVRDLLSREFSPKYARALLLNNPRNILKDEPITLAEPEWF